MTKQTKIGLTALVNEDLAKIMRVFMVDANSGDQTPDQAVQWDFHVDSIVELMVDIKSQNI